MQETSLSRKLLSGILGASLLACFAWGSLEAQPCACNQLQPFGSCYEKKAPYAKPTPGSAVALRIGNADYLYVPDLFQGVTYRFKAASFDTDPNPTIFASPRGYAATTGIAVKPGTLGVQSLHWAIEGELYRTDLEVANSVKIGAVRLADLAVYLRIARGDSSIQAGTLGGITYHKGRESFWGVDIVNDVYFEFDETGTLVLDGGKPVYFDNPKRTAVVDGAYGNTITYVSSGDKEYFDIPVGSLSDRQPTEVWRVHASDGTDDNGFAYKIGTPTGSLYTLGTALGSPKFVTGIAFWGSSCGDGQSSEFVIDIGTSGDTPQIIQVSADAPTAAPVADFTCTSLEAGTVKLTWRKTLPYTELLITRQLVGKTPPTPETVLTTDFANDPQQATDTDLADGTYEYVAKVTAASPVPSVSCRVTVGNGVVVNQVRFTLPGIPDAVPYAVAVAGDKVVVADFNLGDAVLYSSDLERISVINGPVSAGVTTGLAYVSIQDGDVTEERLYWLQNWNDRHFLTGTDMAGRIVAPAVIVEPPPNLILGFQLGEIAYDPALDFFWTVDLRNAVIYGFGADGITNQIFKTKQIPVPEPGGFVGGGIAVAASSGGAVTLDIPAGSKTAGFVDQIVRSEYDTGNLTAAARELFRVDLRSTIGSADVGGLDILNTQTEVFEYVAAQDTRTVYKLRITGPTSGETRWRRGDVNNDNAINISDPSFLLEKLFRGGNDPPCSAAADANKSNSLDISDAIYLFSYLFKGGNPPAAPFPGCGTDATETLECKQAFCSG